MSENENQQSRPTPPERTVTPPAPVQQPENTTPAPPAVDNAPDGYREVAEGVQARSMSDEGRAKRQAVSEA